MTPATVWMVVANGAISDDRRMQIVARKLGVLTRIQSGEDPDVAAFRESVEERRQQGITEGTKEPYIIQQNDQPAGKNEQVVLDRIIAIKERIAQVEGEMQGDMFGGETGGKLEAERKALVSELQTLNKTGIFEARQKDEAVRKSQGKQQSLFPDYGTLFDIHQENIPEFKSTNEAIALAFGATASRQQILALQTRLAQTREEAKGKTGQEALNYGFKTQFDREAIQEAQKRTNIVAQVTPNANIQDRAERQRDYQANVDIVRKIQLGFDLTGFQQSRTPQVNLLGSSIARDLSIRGSAEIIGQRINTTNDFAAIMQIYRNPGFEISHYVFVKDGKVVGHTMFTFRIPTASTIIPPNVDRDSLSNWLNEQMTRYGADGFYFVHNHPGGNPTPSQADVDASLSIGKSHARFLGHVIIDSNRYAFLKSYAGGIKSEVIDAKFLKDPDAIYRASVPHPILGAVALTQDHLARIASQVNNRENNLVLIGRKLGVVSGVGLLSKDILKPSQIKKLGEILREFAVSTGSMDVALTNIPADANNETLQKIVDLMLGGYLIESMDETGVSLTNVIKLAGGSESSVPKHSRFGISSRDATLLESPQVMREGEGTLLKIGQNVVRAFRGNSRYVPLDGLAGTISFAAYRGIGAIKGLVRYLGIPSYVGNRVPALREAFYALREGMFEGNERYQAVAEMITKIKEELNPTDEEGQNVATALYRGNDKDQQRYYTEAELRSRFNMTDREVLIYSAMVAAQKEATAIKIDAVKFYMMQHDLDLKDVAEINPSDPEFSSLSREQLEALTEIVTDLRAHRFAFSSPRIERIWEDIQPLVKQVVVDRKATEMVRRLGGYLSLQRTGEWYVRWRDAEGKLNWNQYQLQQEAAKAAKFYKDQGFTEVDSGRTREINFASSYVDQLSLAELMDLIEQLGIEKNKQVQKLVDEFKRMGFAAHMITRKYVPGYERTFDNAIRSIHDYARGAGSNLARTKGKILALRSLDNINGSENPGEYKLVKDYIDGYFGMRGEEGSLLRKAVYTSALSWSPTFVIQQIFQPYVTHLPNIGAEVGALRAPKILEQANAMTVSHMLHLPKALSLPAELRAFLQRAGMRESIAGSMIEEFAGHVQMSGRAMAPRTTEAFVSLGVKKETMQNILAKAETIIEFAGAVTERKNRIQGFIAGYLIGKDKGLTGEALFKYAERFTEYVNIPYGKQNLPIAIMHAGHFRGLARLFYTFISFQSAIYHMAGQAIRGKLPLSKKAAAVAYGTLSWVGLAGVQGIPLYWLFKFIWKSLIGGDPEDELRKVSEDLPTAAKEILDSGIMSQVGVDLRRSLGAGEAAPFTSFYPIRAVQQAASAYDYFERGEVKKGIARLPIGVPPLARGAMRSLEAQQGGISYGARTLVPADKLTTRQKLLLAFNLTPMEVGKSYDVERRLSDEQKARAFQFDVFADKYARALIAQDTAGRTAIIEQIKKYNEQVREKYPSLMVEGKSFRMAVERRVRELKLGIDKTDSRRGGLLRRTLKERVTP
jgi:proteasome lid subunit RPN8/RPN11